MTILRPMTRRKDIEHPDDLKKLQENIEKAEMKFERTRLRLQSKVYKKRSYSKYDQRKDEPHIDDTRVFKAVSFARHIRFNDNKPIGLAMYLAAKYYKVPLAEVAKAMGELACYHRWNR